MTVKQLADKLGTSKTTIKRYMERLGVAALRNSTGTLELDENAANRIISAFWEKNPKQVSEQVAEQVSPPVAAVPQPVAVDVAAISAYEKTIKLLEAEVVSLRNQLAEERRRADEAVATERRSAAEQLAAKDEQITTLSTLLSQQQQLQLATLAALPEPKEKGGLWARIFKKSKTGDPE